jgi:hypothetical protein
VNIIVKSDETRRRENAVLREHGRSPRSKEARELAECVVARTGEAVTRLRKMEERK